MCPCDQEAGQEEHGTSLVLDMMDAEGHSVAEQVTGVAWSDAGGMALLAAATRSSIAIFTLHR